MMAIAPKSFSCAICARRFRSASGLSDHEFAVHQCPKHKCPACPKRFPSQIARQQHQHAKGHVFCVECDLPFSKKCAFEVHCRQPHFCELCSKTLKTLQALREHRQAAHSTQFHCCMCDRDFVDGTALRQHLAHKIHPATKEYPSNTCSQCGKVFSSPNNLKHHENSIAHKPLARLTCFNEACRSLFNCPSALLHHLESGNCPCGWTRKHINAVLHKHDVDRVLTTGIISLQTSAASAAGDISASASASEIAVSTPSDWSLVDSEEDFEVCSMQTTDSPYGQFASTMDNPRSGAGALGEDYASGPTCALCLIAGNDRTFKSMAALGDHLSSAVHDQKAFKCPRAFFPDHPDSGSAEIKYFKTLSGMVQHLESGKCFGGRSALWKMLDYLRSEVLQLEWPGKLLQE